MWICIWYERRLIGLVYNILLFKVLIGWLDELNCRKKFKKINVVVLGKNYKMIFLNLRVF